MSIEKRKPWAKAWRETWRDEAGDELDMCATLLRQLLLQHVGEADEDGTGWATTEDGRPITPTRMARLCKASDEQIEDALEQLVRAGVAVFVEGRWGVLGWRRTQEDPENKRKREWRERSQPGTPPSHVPSHVPSQSRDKDDQRTEDRGQRTETPHPQHAGAGEREESPASALTSRPRTPPLATTIGQRLALARELVGMAPGTAATRSGIARGLFANLEADAVLPTREQLRALAGALGDPSIADWPLPERDPHLVATVAALHHALAAGLGLADPGRPPTPSAHDVAAVYAAEAADADAGLTLAEGWPLVLARAHEQLLREQAAGNQRGRQFFTLRSLAGKRRPELLAALDLDRRDDTVPGAPPGRRNRGPAPPTNQCDQSGEIPT